jgi:hypothetical protein
VDTLGEEVGIGERQTQKHLRTLERMGFIRTAKRFKADRTQTSNGYVFLWHPVFDDWEREQKNMPEGANSSSPCPVNNNSPYPVHDSSSCPVNRTSPKEGHYKEGHIEQDELEAVNFVSLEEGQGEGVPFMRPDFYRDPESYDDLAAKRRERLKDIRLAARTEPLR